MFNQKSANQGNEDAHDQTGFDPEKKGDKSYTDAYIYEDRKVHQAQRDQDVEDRHNMLAQVDDAFWKNASNNDNEPSNSTPSQSSPSSDDSGRQTCIFFLIMAGVVLAIFLAIVGPLLPQLFGF